MSGYNWRRAEAWRSHPLLRSTWRSSFPGLLPGLVIFGLYVAYDKSQPKTDGH
jgi:NADH-ubiquinone oxidoreductase B12 subunit family